MARVLTVAAPFSFCLGVRVWGDSALQPVAGLSLRLQNWRMRASAFRQNKKRMLLALASTSNSSQGKRSSGDAIIMVDPLEAKRLAEKQMLEIKAKQKFMRRRQAEAINGALAMIGLTAGLVVEGQTGKGILGQVAGYLAAFMGLFMK